MGSHSSLGLLRWKSMFYCDNLGHKLGQIWGGEKAIRMLLWSVGQRHAMKAGELPCDASSVVP